MFGKSLPRERMVKARKNEERPLPALAMTRSRCAAEATSDENSILRKDAEFNSPSGASIFLHGTSRNGRTDWLVEGKGITYAEWKEKEIAEAVGSNE